MNRPCLLGPGLAVILVLAGLSAPCATAQSSAHFKLQESAFNAAGHPADGAVLTSSHFRIRLDAVGDSVAASGLSSASFHAGGGFAAGYPPPGEVSHLRFTSRTALTWDPERSTGTYSLYRGLVASLPGLVFGTCSQSGLTGNQTTDAGSPPVGSSWFYLVTARNLLGEEGTKGSMSSGAERPNPSPCP